MSTDEKFLDQCHAYLDGTLSADETDAFLKHVDSDPSCELAFRKLSKAISQLKNHSQVEPALDLESRILAAVHDEANRPKLTVLTNPKWKAPLQIAAATLLVVAAGFMLTLKPAEPGATQAMSDTQLEEELATTWQEADTAFNSTDTDDDTDIIDEMSI
jgi:anti-sigma factor RsiW